MRDYKIGLELTGAMTQVPDSQKLFGALVYLFAERYGDGSAAKLTKAVKDKGCIPCAIQCYAGGLSANATGLFDRPYFTKKR